MWTTSRCSSEFGGTYRLVTLPVGPTGRVTLEALAGGRLMHIDAELTVGGQSRSRTGTLIDPMFGGRIAYHITDTVGLWFRGTWLASESPTARASSRTT